MVEKNQQFDFKIEYIKGEEMGLADELSRGESLCGTTESEHGKKKQRKWDKHVKTIRNKEYWIFDNGQAKLTPSEKDREKLCVEAHINVIHRWVNIWCINSWMTFVGQE